MNDMRIEEWPVQREPFDAAARNPALAARLAALLPERPRLLDIGAGTAPLFRWLAPRLQRPQAWTLAESDGALLDEGFREIAVWATRHGWTVTYPGRAMLVHTPEGAWRLEGLVTNLAAAPETLPLDATDAVLCGSLLPLVSRDWLERLIDALRTPFLACLTDDGRDSWLPRHAADRLVASGLRRARSYDAGFGPALGIQATSVAAGLLRDCGFDVTLAASDWRIPRTALRMARMLTQDTAAAARAALPRRTHTIDAWETTRLRQSLAARLGIRIGHRDMLALPEEG